MQVEMMDSPIPDEVENRTGMETSNDSGNGQDSGSVCTMTTSQSSSTLRSKYQYRSPMEQEEYQRLSDFRRSLDRDSSDRTKSKTNSSRSKRSGFRSTNTPSKAQLLHLTREASPTDTVSSFEYQSQSQMISQMRNKRLPSYTTDGYDTSSEDDSVFHHVQQPVNLAHMQKKTRQPVARKSSFKVEYSPKNMPNLALMTALPPTSNSPSYMPNAIPSIPQTSHVQQLNRIPRSRSASNNRKHNVNLTETSTFV